MDAPHEALAMELSCPVCLELFTPPVLELPCGHNFCKQCIEATLFAQNCTHVNGQFYCPICRKLTYLRGKGIAILKRNMFAENVLEKFKQDLEVKYYKEQRQQPQMCEKHEEEFMNLMCLQDDVPICSICKLFGDHQCHDVAKLSDVYQERKKCFVKDMESLCIRNESISGTIQEIEKHINNTVLSCMDVKEMIDTVGKILLRQLKSRINSLKMEVDNKSVQRTGELQEVLAALQRPTQLYLQMKRLLDSHPNAVHFLREDKPLRAEADKLAHEVLPQAPMEGNISVAYYLRELVKGINIKDFSSSGMNNVPLDSREAINAWVSICSDLNALPTDDLDQVIHRIMCSLGFKDSGTDKNESLLSMASAPHCVNSAQQMEELPAERTDV